MASRLDQARQADADRNWLQQRKKARTPAATREVLASEGEPLQAEARAKLESGLGQDLGHVRVHRDARAGHSARSMGAQAYTVGHHMVFGENRYAPQTDSGMELLAHEATHVVQQSRGAAAGQHHTEAAETRADTAGQKIARGETATAAEIGAAPVGIQAQDDPAAAPPPTPGPEALKSRKSLETSETLDGFVTDKADLLPAHIKEIDSLAFSAGLHLGITIRAMVAFDITGHTDTKGSSEHNEQLGTQRAASAKAELEKALVKNKVPKDRILEITTDSDGEENLAVPTKDEVDEPRNRRVEIKMEFWTPPSPDAPVPSPDVSGDPFKLPPIGGTPPWLDFKPIPPINIPPRDWLKNELERNKLLKKLPDSIRKKAIDGLKDADEKIAEKIIDQLPLDGKEKKALKAAVKALLQTLKGKKFKPPTPPPPGLDMGPKPKMPKAPGEVIFPIKTWEF